MYAALAAETYRLSRFFRVNRSVINVCFTSYVMTRIGPVAFLFMTMEEYYQKAHNFNQPFVHF
jgi:hypothetical protein